MSICVLYLCESVVSYIKFYCRTYMIFVKGEKRGRVCKPGSVPRGMTPFGDGHLSRRPVARPFQRSTRDIKDGAPCSRRNRLCSALLRRGFAGRAVTRVAGELLPHHFTLTGGKFPLGGMLSAALSLILRPVDVIHPPSPAEPGLSSAAALLAKSADATVQLSRAL